MIVDISLKQGDGIELVKDARAHYPTLPLLVLSMHDESIYAERMLSAGANGYIMKQAANVSNLELPMLLPGVNVKTAPDDYFPFERARLARWDGRTWVLFGKVYGR